MQVGILTGILTCGMNGVKTVIKNDVKTLPKTVIRKFKYVNSMGDTLHSSTRSETATTSRRKDRWYTAVHIIDRAREDMNEVRENSLGGFIENQTLSKKINNRQLRNPVFERVFYSFMVDWPTVYRNFSKSEFCLKAKGRKGT